MSPVQITENDRIAYNKHRGWFFVCGIVLLLLGIAAISLAAFTTLLSVVILGIVAFIGGILIVIDSFKFWWGKVSGFLLHLLFGLLYLAVGFVLIKNPIQGAVSLTLLLAIFYIILGLVRIFYSISLQTPRWGWVLFNGIIALLLGVLILMHWPSSSLIIIGLFVGIDLLLAGFAYLMVGFAAKTIGTTVTE